MAKTFTVQDFFRRFPDDASCLDHLMRLRFGETLICRKCGKEGRFVRLAKLPAYSCPWCGDHIHPMVGTPFEKSRTPLQKWFYAMYLFTTSRHSVPAKELQRQLGITYKAAWRMGHQIRQFMADVDGDDELSGHVEVDETIIGGRLQHVGSGSHSSKKTVVFGMLQRGGNVMTRVVPDTRRATLEPHIFEKIKAGSRISSDELTSYRLLRTRYIHKTVHHGAKEYVHKDTHVNTLEGFWSMLKRAISGTHVSVSKKWMHRYLGEFEYRYNMRQRPEFMFARLLLSF